MKLQRQRFSSDKKTIFALETLQGISCVVFFYHASLAKCVLRKIVS
jgi:hypothetical protein